jgi:hypothetical protein
LRECCRFKPLGNARTKGFHRLNHADEFVPVGDLPFELLLLQHQRRMARFQVLPAPFVLSEAHDLRQVRFREAFQLSV